MNTLEAFNYLASKKDRLVRKIATIEGYHSNQLLNYEEFISDELILHQLFEIDNKRKFKPVLKLKKYTVIKTV